MKWIELLMAKSLGESKMCKPEKLVKKEHLNILAKYKCKMNHIKCCVLLSDEYLIIEDKTSKYRLSCIDIKQVSIQEKLWSIRVKLQCKKNLYQFDFPSYKVATKFYEQLIYSKVKANVR